LRSEPIIALFGIKIAPVRVTKEAPMKKLIYEAAVALAAAATALPVYATGLLRPVDSQYGDLEIKQHKVQVVLNNGFAKTEVDQVFHNPHDKDLEAVYTLPLPEKASMSELSLWIDGKEAIGEVLAKEEARAAYEEEKAQGRVAGRALMQSRLRVFLRSDALREYAGPAPGAGRAPVRDPGGGGRIRIRIEA
jgi:hypothetical protein